MSATFPSAIRGGPAICSATRMMRFESEAAAKLYLARNCPSFSLSTVSRCSDCGGLHVETSRSDRKTLAALAIGRKRIASE